MSWRRFSAGTVAIVVCVGGLRFGARLLRPQESSHQSAQSCGALVWRTTTVMRKSRFEPVPVLVREESVVDLEGRPIATDVADFRCILRRRSLASIAAVVRRVDGARADVTILDATGAVERVVHFEHDVASTWWSRDAERFAAVGPGGEISFAELASSKPVVLSRDKGLVGGRVTWSQDEKSVCFVTGKRPAGDEGNAVLLCAEVPAEPVTVTRAAWTGSGDVVPWVGFVGGKAHLCGDEMKPRDVACIGMSRPRD